MSITGMGQGPYTFTLPINFGGGGGWSPKYKLGDRVQTVHAGSPGTVTKIAISPTDYYYVKMDASGVDTVWPEKELEPICPHAVGDDHFRYEWQDEMMTSEPMSTGECECGAHSFGVDKHSDWCKLHKKDE